MNEVKEVNDLWSSVLKKYNGYDEINKIYQKGLEQIQNEQKKSQSKPKGTSKAVADYNKKKLADNVDGNVKEAEKAKKLAPPTIPKSKELAETKKEEVIVFSEQGSKKA